MDQARTKDPILIFLIFTFFLSVITKFYIGPAQIGVSYYMNSIFVVLTGCLLLGSMLPDMKHRNIAVIVFAIMCCMEMFQIFFPERFTSIRDALLYPQLLDSMGSWHKMPFYGIAAFLGTYFLNNYKRHH